MIHSVVPGRSVSQHANRVTVAPRVRPSFFDSAAEQLNDETAHFQQQPNEDRQYGAEQDDEGADRYKIQEKMREEIIK